MKTQKNIIFQNIERLGEKYIKKVIFKQFSRRDLENSWWEGLKFFFSHSFMRGRRDKLSNEYFIFTINVLENLFFDPDKDLNAAYQKLLGKKDSFGSGHIKNIKVGKKNAVKSKEFAEIMQSNTIVESLHTGISTGIEWKNDKYQKDVILNNDEDIMMVLDVLLLISDKKKRNIYNYFKDRISQNDITKAFKELMNIRAIGEKLATFIIRDIALINPDTIKLKDHKLAFPVDTWVDNIARKLGYREKGHEELSEKIIPDCQENGIDPLKFAAGLWYLGFNSLEILIEDCLNKIEI